MSRDAADAGAAVELPLLSYQEGRLLMDARARRLSITSVRNVPTAYRLRGPLDVARLVESLQELVRRHEALRVVFPAGAARQVILDDVALDVPLVEIASEATADEDVQSLLETEAERPLDGSVAPRLRATIVRRRPDDHVLYLVFDHLVVDGWSRGIVLDELSALYAHGSAQEPSPLPAISLRYRDHVLEQRRIVGGSEGARLLAFWRQRLEGVGAIPVLALPPAPELAGAPASGASRARVLPDDLAEAVVRFSRTQRVTPFMTLLAAFQIVLRRSTGRDDQTIAVNVFNRASVPAQRLVAPLADLAVIRTDLSEARTFLDAVQHVRERALEAHRYSGLPYGELVKALNPDVYGDPTVPIGVVFNMLYEEVIRDDFELAGLSCTPVPVAEASFRPRSVLVLTASMPPGQVVLSAQYQADRVLGSAVEGLLEDLESVLSAGVREPMAARSAGL